MPRQIIIIFIMSEYPRIVTQVEAQKAAIIRKEKIKKEIEEYDKKACIDLIKIFNNNVYPNKYVVIEIDTDKYSKNSVNCLIDNVKKANYSVVNDREFSEEYSEPCSDGNSKWNIDHVYNYRHMTFEEKINKN